MPAIPCLGPAAILRMVYAKQDLTALTSALILRVLGAAPDPGAMMDLATLLQARGPDWAAECLALQQQAVALQPSYQVIHGNGTGPRVLALVTPGDFMANTPVDFLLAGSDAVLILHHVTAAGRTALHLPPYDVAILAIGQSDQNAPVLAALTPLIAGMALLNNAPDVIAGLTRDHVSDLLADASGLHAPRTHRLTRDDLATRRFPDGLTFPMLLRPVGSHAGAGLDQIIDAAELGRWLAEHPVAEVYAAPFIDYRGRDGFFTKHRVVLIGGKPWPSHLAASDHWMVHYLNADMEHHADRRAIEAAWMQDFDAWAARHAAAFRALHRLIPLDYFGIDCAEGPDGRLLVFEVDTAMIVHDMDDPALFPYKPAAMRGLFEAFLNLLTQRPPPPPTWSGIPPRNTGPRPSPERAGRGRPHVDKSERYGIT